MLEAAQTIIADLYDNYVVGRILCQRCADRGLSGASEYSQQFDPVHDRRIITLCKMYLATNVGGGNDLGLIY